jgi:tRNA pseudouridine38-40 synthase
MRKGAEAFIGEHDFAAFCNLRKNYHYESTVRIVTSITIIEHPENALQLVVKGNHFLYKMVRNIVGTLAYIGHGKLQYQAVSSILKGLARANAGITAPAHGLTLFKVFY